MSSTRYTEEFKIEAVKQITERRHTAAKTPAKGAWLLAGLLSSQEAGAIR